jgi:hypothetical protein
MQNITFPVFPIGDLSPTDWVRFPDGDVGVIHDKVDHEGYRKACVEVPGARYPIRIVEFATLVEHVTDRQCVKTHGH